MSETIQLLRRIDAGDSEAEERLYALLHDELRARAGRLMRNQRADHTLQASALVNEAWLKLAGLQQPNWQDRVHFLRTATRAMQSVLVDHARACLTAKRGGAVERVELDSPAPARDEASALQMLALDEALSRLETTDAGLHHVAQLHVIGGIGNAEIAQILGVSTRTVERSWKAAQAWLKRELE